MTNILSLTPCTTAELRDERNTVEQEMRPHTIDVLRRLKWSRCHQFQGRRIAWPLRNTDMAYRRMKNQTPEDGKKKTGAPQRLPTPPTPPPQSRGPTQQRQKEQDKKHQTAPGLTTQW